MCRCCTKNAQDDGGGERAPLWAGVSCQFLPPVSLGKVSFYFTILCVLGMWGWDGVGSGNVRWL